MPPPDTRTPPVVKTDLIGDRPHSSVAPPTAKSRVRCGGGRRRRHQLVLQHHCVLLGGVTLRHPGSIQMRASQPVHSQRTAIQFNEQSLVTKGPRQHPQLSGAAAPLLTHACGTAYAPRPTGCLQATHAETSSVRGKLGRRTARVAATGLCQRTGVVTEELGAGHQEQAPVDKPLEGLRTSAGGLGDLAWPPPWSSRHSRGPGAAAGRRPPGAASGCPPRAHLLLAVGLLKQRHDLLARGIVQPEPGLQGAAVVHAVDVPAGAPGGAQQAQRGRSGDGHGAVRARALHPLDDACRKGAKKWVPPVHPLLPGGRGAPPAGLRHAVHATLPAAGHPFTGTAAPPARHARWRWPALAALAGLTTSAAPPGHPGTCA